MTTATQPPYFESIRYLSIGGQPVTVTTATFTAPNDPTQVFYFNSASAQTFTIPSRMTAFPVGSAITIVQLGAGAVTVVAGTSVTINTALSSLVSKGQYNVAQLMNVGPDAWVAIGGLGG